MQLEITQDVPLNVIVLTHFSNIFQTFSFLGQRLINMVADFSLRHSSWLSPGPDSNAHMLSVHIIAHFSSFLPFPPASVETG